MAERDNWLEETNGTTGVTFSVTQRNTEPLKIAIILLLGTAALAFVTWICGENQSPILAIFVGLLAAFCALMTVITFIIAIPLVLFSSATTQFTVTPRSIALSKKYKTRYPAELPFENISEYYVLPPDGRKPKTTLTISTTTYSGGLIGGLLHASNKSGEAAGEAGKAIGELIAKSRYALAVNHRGKEIVLAGLLTDDEATFLCHRFEAALKQLMSHT